MKKKEEEDEKSSETGLMAGFPFLAVRRRPVKYLDVQGEISSNREKDGAVSGDAVAMVT